MVASLQIGTASSYYARAYYHGGEHQVGATWFARRGQFGLTDGEAVDPAIFERLHAGRDATGASILTTTGRTVEGVDLCFAPGKSVSLAYALTRDETLRGAMLDAHHHAVRAALTVLENEAIVARRGRGGLQREKVALTAALFTHDSARPERHADGRVFGDMQLHTHAVLLNLCVRGDSTVGSIDTRLGRWKLCAGAAYHAHLAHKLQGLGFAIEEIGSNGTFEIGFTSELRSYFSTRREHVVETVAKAGLLTREAPDIAAQAALSTRRTKGAENGSERFARWRTEVVRLGHDPDSCLAALISPRELGQDSEARRRRLDRVPEELTRDEAAVARHDLIRALAAAHVGIGADPGDLIATADRVIRDGLMQQIRRTPIGEAVYSTPEMIRIEREVLSLASDLGARAWGGVDAEALQRRAVGAGLSGEQAEATRNLAQPCALGLLEGRAGTGKSHALRPLVDQLRRDGYRVIAAATAWRTARMLAEDLGVEARALNAWLAAERGFVDARTVILVDEAGQLGARSTHTLLTVMAGVPGSKLILIGDRQQLQPIAAGAGLGIVDHAVDGAVMAAIQRQRAPEHRLAVEHLARGEVEPAFTILERAGAVTTSPTRHDAIDAAVDHWMARRQDRADAAHLLLARSNTQVRLLNTAVRRRLREAKSLAGDDVTVLAGTPSGQSFDLPLAVGDRIRFGVRVDRLGVINGTPGVVEHVVANAPDEAVLTVRLADERITFSTGEIVDRKGRVRLAHDYATTVYAAQGLTAETCTVLVEPTFDRHEFYVAASRARGETRLILDEQGLDALARSARRLDQGRSPTEPEERRAVLIERLSRSRSKSTTLDLPPKPAPPLRRERELALG